MSDCIARALRPPFRRSAPRSLQHTGSSWPDCLGFCGKGTWVSFEVRLCLLGSVMCVATGLGDYHLSPPTVFPSLASGTTTGKVNSFTRNAGKCRNSHKTILFDLAPKLRCWAQLLRPRQVRLMSFCSKVIHTTVEFFLTIASYSDWIDNRTNWTNGGEITRLETGVLVAKASLPVR